MSKRLAIRLGLVLALSVPVAALAQNGANVARSNEPTIDDIYKAAESGRLSDADAMMAKVLAAHPGSAKAHFVHAELLSKEGKLGAAKSELAQARDLAPGLPFAKPDAVAGLTERLDGSAPVRSGGLPSRMSSASATAPDASSGMGTPAKIGIVALVLAACVLVFRRVSGGSSPMRPGGMGSASTPAAPTYASWPSGYAPAPPNPNPATGYAQPPGSAPVPARSGLGGALMTGAAMGLGAVAVEEAVRHLSRRDDRTTELSARNDGQPAFANDLGPDGNADMGGNNFGISDAGSWDTGGGTDSSSSDW